MLNVVGVCGGFNLCFCVFVSCFFLLFILCLCFMSVDLFGIFVNFDSIFDVLCVVFVIFVNVGVNCFVSFIVVIFLFCLLFDIVLCVWLFVCVVVVWFEFEFKWVCVGGWWVRLNFIYGVVCILRLNFIYGYWMWLFDWWKIVWCVCIWWCLVMLCDGWCDVKWCDMCGFWCECLVN